jgi:hypothetical protein
MPIYEEKLNVNYPFAVGLLVWALAVGLIPGFLLSGLWWFSTTYIALTVIIIALFFQMRVALYEDRLTIRYGLIYHKTIEAGRIEDCAPYKVAHPIKTYGGWGLRKGKDGSFAITQAFINESVKLKTVGQVYIISSRTPERFCDAIKGLKKK